MIKAYKNMSYKKNGVLSVFEKSYEEKRRKNQFQYIQDYVIHTKN